MLEFVRKSFRGFFEFWLWLNLILFVIIGGVFGNGLAGRGDSGGYIFGGIIVGAIIGLIIDIIGGGLIATFLEMSENIKKIAGGNVAEENHEEPSDGGKPIEEGRDISSTTNEIKKESYVVQQEMKLYKKQGDYNEVVRILNPGENVSYFKSGNNVSVANIDAPMFYIKTGRGELGWCFSGFLK
jgi:hypothetical protein